MTPRLLQALEDVRNALRLAREDREKYRVEIRHEGARSYFVHVRIEEEK